MAESNKDYYHYAFFSAFTTLPSFEKAKTFFDGEISEIFRKYREALLTIQKTACNDDSCKPPKDDLFLHQPVPYCLFGDFDMAVFSLIDDFSFATKKFKPTASSKGYKYQINTGIIPFVDAYEPNSKISIFVKNAIPNFFNGTDFYPFTGIASIKLNNAMLVGIGEPFLKMYNFFLITHLDEWVETMEKAGKKFFYFLNENLGWNELSIYFFGSSLKEIQELLMTIRQFRLRDIKDHFTRLLENKGIRQSYIHSDIIPVFESIKSASLLGKLIIGEEQGKDCLESHPIIASSVSYGFHIDMILLHEDETTLKTRIAFKNPDSDFVEFKKEYADMDSIRIGWKIKPGHEHAANELILSCFPEEKSNIIDQSRTGKYPFRFPQQLISVKAYLDFCKRIEMLDGDEISKHIVKMRSHIRWDSEIPLKPFVANLHYDYKLSDYQIQPQQIEKIKSQLRVNPIPYIYKSQIENLITNYNDAIADPLMYNYFIGLKMPLLNFLQEQFLTGLPDETIAIDENQVNTEFQELIDIAGDDNEPLKETDIPNQTMIIDSVDAEAIADFIQAWNKAYWNRYFHSYYFTEINDFNIEHHGGIQQLLFTYDVIYKLIARRIFGKESKVPFVNVQVNHFITSTQYYNSINFTHLFRPAIYACECVHEAANHIIPYLVDSKEVKEFNFLFNPRSNYDQIEPDKIREFLEFEKSLERKVNPREKFEVLYLTEHFGMNAIRHMVADYATYLLGYTDPYKYNTAAQARAMDKERVKIFYESHWYLFLIRADLYFRELRHTGGWFFKQDDFMALFIRFNLMLHLFLDFTEEDLDDLNKVCPSIELKPIWESEKHNLIKLTVRLGSALRSEFDEQLKRRNINKNGFLEFRDKIDQTIFDENWQLLGDEQNFYKEAIKNNQDLIFSFHEIFTNGDRKHNVIIRNSKNNTDYPFECNIKFYERDDDRDLFLDPKGNLFSTTPERRQEIFEKNISYIKKMWDLSLKAVLKDYQ